LTHTIPAITHRNREIHMYGMLTAARQYRT
jgi:hypothetical protein